MQLRLKRNGWTPRVEAWVRTRLPGWTSSLEPCRSTEWSLQTLESTCAEYVTRMVRPSGTGSSSISLTVSLPRLATLLYGLAVTGRRRGIGGLTKWGWRSPAIRGRYSTSTPEQPKSTRKISPTLHSHRKSISCFFFFYITEAASY